MGTLHHILSIFTLTQSRTTNIPLFLLFQVLYVALNALALDSAEVSITTLLLQFASFFAMGGNNAMSGVDLSSAYNGISDFNVVAVGVLIFVSNWASSLWWASAGNLLLLRSMRSIAADTTQHEQSKVAPEDKNDRTKATRGFPGQRGQWYVWRQHIGAFTVFTAASLVAVMVACTALRTHLFIWTVFSPKYLYSMAWSLGMHLGGNVAFGGFLFWLGSR